MDQTENQAVTETVDEVNTSMPTSPVENQTPSEELVEPDVLQPSEDTETNDDYQEPESLPEEGSEQAKAFQRLRQERKKLLDENEQLKKGLSDRKTRQSHFEQLKNPGTSDIDQTVEYKLDEIKAKEQYPQLDPSSDKYDSDFEEEVASVYFFNLYQGRQAKISDIAKRLTDKRGMPKAELKKVEAEVTQKVKQGITQKEQASLSAQGRSQPGYASAQEHESLVNRSRTGDNWAIAERLKRASS